jgi:hypothetical protein
MMKRLHLRRIKMDEIVIYGASDDLIEVESTSFRAEEFNVLNAACMEDGMPKFMLAVSDGTVLRVHMDDDGVWRFAPSVVGSASVDIKYGTDDREHTDRVTLTGDDLCWVVLATEIAK